MEFSRPLFFIATQSLMPSKGRFVYCSHFRLARAGLLALQDALICKSTPKLKQISRGDTVTLQQTEGMDTVLKDSDSSLGLWKASIYHLNPCFILVPASASSLELCPGLQMQIFVHSRHLWLSRQFPALCGTCHSDNLMNEDHTSSKHPAFSSPSPLFRRQRPASGWLLK